MMNAEPPLHQDGDLTGINDGSLSDGSRGTVLNLVSSDTSPKTLVFVKLTDSSMRAIIDFLEAKNRGLTANASQQLKPRIKFDQNTKGGSFSFPSPPANGQDWKLKSFSFSLLPLNDGGPRGSFECIRQGKSLQSGARNYRSSSPTESQLLESLGPMSYKMQVSGCEDSFENTRARMFDITQNSLKNSAKEIEQDNAGPNIGRKIKTNTLKMTNGNHKMLNGRPKPVQHDKVGLQSKMPFRPILNKNQEFKNCSTSGGTTSSTSLSESSSLHNNHNRLSSPSMPMKRPPSEVSNGTGPAVKKARFPCDNGLPNLGSRGSLNSTPNSSPGSSAGASSEDSHATNSSDYKSVYTKILSPEQRQRYEMDFERDYKEYCRQHKMLDSIKQKFIDYEQKLYQFEESSDEWQRIVDTIYTEYEQLKSDRVWIRTRSDVRFLHDKLNHIRQLIIDYDSSN